jgi:hypothetical protein
MPAFPGLRGDDERHPCEESRAADTTLGLIDRFLILEQIKKIAVNLTYVVQGFLILSRFIIGN